ncbi:nucleotidyltransferase domain-containing protein [Paenibacillus sp. 1P07SE]|uniref:nucleotidyltransferase domain-containing protein n=1 Tax=Paenibacillus sp. 1P07SE TaxID=3132209 RepID=UPI0039A4A478
MRTDIENWRPLTVAQINAMFAGIPARWYMSGGWALDLHVGKQTRTHSDIDISIIREEQLIVYQHLARDWRLYKAEDGKLELWEEGEFLEATSDVWISKSGDAPWAFQLMIIDRIDNTWIYKREPSIRKPMDDIVLKTAAGIPYLRPEIQLLYKGGSSQIREKDHQDFRMMLPLLEPQEKDWLKRSLMSQFPQGHAWMTCF